MSIPEELRESLGLRPFDEVEVEIAEGRIQMRPANDSGWVLKEGIPVFEGEGDLPVDMLEETLAAVRNRRAQSENQSSAS